MIFPCCWGRGLTLAAIVLAVLAGGALAEEPPLRQLRGKKYSEAVTAQRRADLMRAELQRSLPAARGEPDPNVSPTPDKLPPEVAKVVAAYQEVIDAYPYTEISRYCTLRLSGVYHYLGHFDKAAEIARQATAPPSAAVAALVRHDAVVQDLAEAIRAAARGPKVTEAVRSRIAGLEDAKIDPVATLKQLYGEHDKGGVQERSIILLALQEIGGPQALEAIRTIALEPGDSAQTMGPRAVAALVALTADPELISEALGSDSTDARNAAAAQLRDKQLSAVAVGRLASLLTAEQWWPHTAVAAAFGSDRTAGTAKVKIDLLLEALPQLEHLEAEEIDHLGFGSTSRDKALRAYVWSLAEMSGADAPLKKRFAAAPDDGIERQVLALALGMRGEKVVYPAVLRIAEKDADGFLRTMAVGALAKVGTVRDVELLQRLAATDPYTAISHSCTDPDEVVFPVRIAAKDAIRLLRGEKARPDAPPEE